MRDENGKPYKFTVREVHASNERTKLKWFEKYGECLDCGWPTYYPCHTDSPIHSSFVIESRGRTE